MCEVGKEYFEYLEFLNLREVFARTVIGLAHWVLYIETPKKGESKNGENVSKSKAVMTGLEPAHASIFDDFQINVC